MANPKDDKAKKLGSTTKNQDGKVELSKGGREGAKEDFNSLLERAVRTPKK